MRANRSDEGGKRLNNGTPEKWVFLTDLVMLLKIRLKAEIDFWRALRQYQEQVGYRREGMPFKAVLQLLGELGLGLAPQTVRKYLSLQSQLLKRGQFTEEQVLAMPITQLISLLGEVEPNDGEDQQ